MLHGWWRWRARRLLDRARALRAAGGARADVGRVLRAALAAAERTRAATSERERALDALVAHAARGDDAGAASELDGWIERRVGLGRDDLERAAILNALALTLRAARQPRRAEPLARRALELLDATSPPGGDARLEAVLDTVAGIALRLGHHAEAEAALSRLLALEERRAAGLELAATINRLAQVKRALGKNLEASELDERVAELRERRERS